MAFVSSHSQITAQKFQALMLKKDDMAADVGSVVYGEEAVSLGIIDGAGDGNFYPRGQLTAVAFAKVLLTALAMMPTPRAWWAPLTRCTW